MAERFVYPIVARTKSETEANKAIKALHAAGVPFRVERRFRFFWFRSNRPAMLQRAWHGAGIKMKNPLGEALITGLGLGAGWAVADKAISHAVKKNPRGVRPKCPDCKKVMVKTTYWYCPRCGITLNPDDPEIVYRRELIKRIRASGKWPHDGFQMMTTRMLEDLAKKVGVL